MVGADNTRDTRGSSVMYCSPSISLMVVGLLVLVGMVVLVVLVVLVVVVIMKNQSRATSYSNYS